MADEVPKVGMVIRHMYLWRDEQIQGKDEGRKARPCAIVHTRENEYEETEVYICPITHTPPTDPKNAIEIPAQTKKRLGLDDEQSWVITSEVNRFTWVGPDVRKTQSGELTYGVLPGTMTKAIIEKIQTRARKKALGVVERDDKTLLERLRRIKSKSKDRHR